MHVHLHSLTGTHAHTYRSLNLHTPTHIQVMSSVIVNSKIFTGTWQTLLLPLVRKTMLSLGFNKQGRRYVAVNVSSRWRVLISYG